MARRRTRWRGRGGSAPIGRSSCASAGNFGQGVAYAARALGIPAVVFASRNANPRQDRADARARRGGHRGRARTSTPPAPRPRPTPPSIRSELLVDGDDPWIATRRRDAGARADRRGRRRRPAGAGVVVRPGRQRRAHQRRRLVAARAELPACRVVGIQAEGAPAMTLSFQAGRPIDTDAADTYADGIAARVAIPIARRADGRPGRRDDPRGGGGPPRGPGRADRASSGSPSKAPRRRPGPGSSPVQRPTGPAVVIVTGSNV